MNKKVVAVFFIFSVLILSISFTSAFSFSSFQNSFQNFFSDFWNKFTGKITGKAVSYSCMSSGYQCTEVGGSGPEMTCAAINMDYAGDGSLDDSCSAVLPMYNLCCMPKPESVEKSAAKVATTSVLNDCVDNGYICGNTDGAGPMVSCSKLNKDYIGDNNLDLSCDSSGMAGCCGEKTALSFMNISYPEDNSLIQTTNGQITLEVNTDVNADCSYGLYKQILSLTPMENTGGIYHTQIISNLEKNNDYIIAVQCTDGTSTLKKQTSFLVQIVKLRGDMGILTENEIYSENEDINLLV